ncbi:MAG: response regulator [Thainema sp.]
MTSRIVEEDTTVVRILIVEDEYILAINLQETLESMSYAVLDIADTAEDAIAKANELRPDLVLMDIRLRGEMDGIQAAEEIWNRLQIPVIYVTGHSDKSTVERATLTFPFGYILKPVREKELYVAIQTALNRHGREQFLSTVLQGMGDGVVVADPQCRIQYLNPVAESLTGWPLDNATQHLVTDVVRFIDESTQAPLDNPLVAALQRNATVYLEGHTLLIKRDGTTIPVADSAAPLKNLEGAIMGAVMVFRDDTRRRLLEERNLATERAMQLEAQMQELERLNQLKDDFLATTSHELRTPLSSIKLAICMLETVLKQQGACSLDQLPDSEAITRYLNVLREQCDQELKLVNDLLDMRSLDAEAYPLDPTVIRLQDWLPHVVETFQVRARAQQQTLTVDVAADLPPIVTDVPSLTRIVSELLNNACKYTPPEHQIQVIAQLTEAELPAGAAVQIIMRNSGASIANDQLSSIFDPFYRIPENDPWKHGGTGLGLALVKKFVQYLSGAIAVRSNADWVTFTVNLPTNLDCKPCS